MLWGSTATVAVYPFLTEEYRIHARVTDVACIVTIFLQQGRRKRGGWGGFGRSTFP